MTEGPGRTLDDWMPRLLAAWRRLRGQPASDAPLSSPERAEIVAGAQKLSQGLTGERELAGARYFEDPRLLGAYLLLYWPVSYAQARSVLGEIEAPLGQVLDVGSGPGPLALAALDAGASRAKAIDRSTSALAVARTLDGALDTERWEPGRPLPSGPFDLVLAGHLFNELFGADLERRAGLARAMLSRLSPGGRLVILEPALRETSRALLALRDRLMAEGAVVEAPCLYRGDCPALARSGDWCHAERGFALPPLLAELAQAARLHRERLKMSYLVVAAPGASAPSWPSGRLFRIVSEPLPQKGQHRFYGCGPEGRMALVLPHKHLSQRNALFPTLLRGDLVRIERLTARGDGLRLDRESSVVRLAAPGEPPPR